MDELARRRAMLTDAQQNMEEARTGFDRLRAILNAIKRLASYSDVEIADLAGIAAELAEESSREAGNRADEYGNLFVHAEDVQ